MLEQCCHSWISFRIYAFKAKSVYCSRRTQLNLVANSVHYFLSGCTILAANEQNIECIVSPPLLIQCGILANLQTQKTWLFRIPNYNLATVFNYGGISIKSFGTYKIK